MTVRTDSTGRDGILNGGSNDGGSILGGPDFAAALREGWQGVFVGGRSRHLWGVAGLRN